jgi:glycosyltransferase involved in cell wall biosynthesis
MFESASAIVAVSRDMTRQLQELGAPPEKIYYNSCGVDLTQFQGADPANAPPRFLAVGRFVEKKGPLFTIEAFQKVVARCPDACLTMVGDGPLLDDCRRKCEDLGLNEAVRFLPPTPHDEISKLMKSARAFVQHSMISAGGDCEGTPVAVLEAAASGLPVVSTKHGGIKDAVMSGKTGFLVDEGDVDGMAAHMISLVEDPELAGRLGRAGREHMREAFDMEKQIGRLWEILHAALP